MTTVLVAIEVDTLDNTIVIDTELVAQFIRLYSVPDFNAQDGNLRLGAVSSVTIDMRQVEEWAYWSETVGRWIGAYQGERWAAHHDAKVAGTTRVAKRTRTLVSVPPSEWEEVVS